MRRGCEAYLPPRELLGDHHIERHLGAQPRLGLLEEEVDVVVGAAGVLHAGHPRALTTLHLILGDLADARDRVAGREAALVAWDCGRVMQGRGI